MLRDELVKVAQAVPVESFATEDVGEYAGRVYDYHLEHPELERLLRWEGLAFDAGNPDDEQRLALYRDKTAAVEAGQRAGSVTEEIDADHMIFLILSLAGWWSSVPQVARMLTGLRHRCGACQTQGISGACGPPDRPAGLIPDAVGQKAECV